MSNEDRRKENLADMAKNALAGYAATLTAVVCFVLFLIVVTAVVRLIVGASAGVSV